MMQVSLFDANMPESAAQLRAQQIRVEVCFPPHAFVLLGKYLSIAKLFVCSVKKKTPFDGRRGSAGGEQLRRQRLRTDEVARILTCGASSCGRVRRPQREVKPEGLAVAGVCGVA